MLMSVRGTPLVLETLSGQLHLHGCPRATAAPDCSSLKVDEVVTAFTDGSQQCPCCFAGVQRVLSQRPIPESLPPTTSLKAEYPSPRPGDYVVPVCHDPLSVEFR